MRFGSTGGASLSLSLSSFTCLFSVGTHILRSSQGKMRSIWFFFFFFGSGSDFCPVCTSVALPFYEVGRVQEGICCVGLRIHLRFCFGFQFPWWDEMRCKKAIIYLHYVCKTLFRWFCHFGLPSWPWSLLDNIYIFSFFSFFFRPILSFGSCPVCFVLISTTSNTVLISSP